MLQTIAFSLKTAWKLDKGRVLYELIYNFLKQFFNVFYGVYFLRSILVYIERGTDLSFVLLLLCFMLAVNIAFYRVNGYFKEVYLPRFDLKLTQHIYEEIAGHASGVPYDVYNHPDFLNRYKVVKENTAASIQKTLNSLGTMCGLILALAMVSVYVVQVDCFAIVLSLLPLAYTYFIKDKSETYQFRLKKSLANAERKKNYAGRVFYLQEYAKELRMTHVGRVVQSVYDAGAAESIGGHKTVGKKIAIFQFAEACIGDVVIVMLPILYVAFRMLTGASLMIGDFVGIAQSISIFSWDIEWFFDMFFEIKSASLYLTEYREYMSLKAAEKGSGVVLDKEQNVLVCENASYAYPGSEDGNNALYNINLKIKKGEKIAVVGENGAGKTTLVSLLVHLISCTEGSVKLNGIDIEAYNADELRGFFGVVLQDFHIYPMTVRENLSVDGPVEDSRLWDAIERMNLKKQITDLDMMVTHEFDDNGLELSGGQQQRLAIARVLANTYPFIVLDEPTSALDPIAEREIYRLVLNAVTDQTLIFISHRLSTTQMVDRIIVMKDGRIIEEGNHDRLMEQRGHYYHMYTVQQALYGKRIL